ncbi:ribbon-helix-helix domain-containing protein [Tepidimonas sp. HKU78]|uniref:ribbon-helix-helix domain-containing protein n=1 Tax=Tepidimonas sp. HKU78 TaxID=3414504 RepID=UPI003CEE8899
MCEFFVTADPILYESRTRTVRIRGVSTSIRMENLMWDTLARLAAEEGVTTNSLIVQLHDEILRHRGGMSCFLCVGRFLNLSSCRSAWCEGEAVAV